MTPEVRERVTLELSELEQKIAALRRFIAGAPFEALHPEHRALLTLQLHLMTEYAAALQARLDLPPPV